MLPYYRYVNLLVRQTIIPKGGNATRIPRGGMVNRQSAAQKHLKTCQMQTQPEYSGYKPGYSRFCVRSIRSYIHSLRV